MKTAEQPPKVEVQELDKKATRRVFPRYLKVIIFASLGLMILWLITRNQDMGKIWEEFQQANFSWIFLAFIAGILSHIARAIRWNLLISPLGFTPKVSMTFYAVMTGYLANLAVPRLGELTRCATLNRYAKIPFNSLVGTVVAERVFDMISLLVLIFFTVIFQFTFLKDFLNKYIFDNLISILSGNIVLMAVAAVAGMVLLVLFIGYMKKTSSSGVGFSGKIKRQMLGFWKGIIALKDIKKKGQFLFLSAMIWFLYFLTVYLVFFALPGTSGLGVADGFTVLVLGSLGVVAPVPGGIGTYHFIVILTMTELLSVNLEPATSYAYISHAVQMITILILGGYTWLMLTFRVKSSIDPVKA